MKFFHFDYAEPHPTLFKDNKDNANRVQYKAFLSEKRKVKNPNADLSEKRKIQMDIEMKNEEREIIRMKNAG